MVIDYGNLGEKLQKILEIQKSRTDNGERASEIIVIDATRKASASKRDSTGKRDSVNHLQHSFEW